MIILLQYSEVLIFNPTQIRSFRERIAVGTDISEESGLDIDQNRSSSNRREGHHRREGYSGESLRKWCCSRARWNCISTIADCRDTEQASWLFDSPALSTWLATSSSELLHLAPIEHVSASAICAVMRTCRSCTSKNGGYVTSLVCVTCTEGIATVEIMRRVVAKLALSHEAP